MRAVLGIAVLITLLVVIVTRFGGGNAKTPPNLGADLPTGVTIVPLGTAMANQLPPTPDRLTLERLALLPGASLPLQKTSGPELLYVEDGVLIVADELGIEGPYAAGKQYFAQLGASYALRNDDQMQPASVLRLRLAPATAEVPTPLSGTPLPLRGRAAADDGTVTLLFADDVGQLPEAPAFVFLARATWAPGARLDQHTFAGPVGLVATSGTLAALGPSGVTGVLQPGGSGAVFPSGSVNQQWNESSTKSAVMLMAGVVAMDPKFIRKP